LTRWRIPSLEDSSKSYYEEEELGDRPRAHRVVLGLRASLLPRSGSREVDSGPVNPPETPEVA